MPEEKIETEVLDDDDIVLEDGRAQEPESGFLASTKGPGMCAPVTVSM